MQHITTVLASVVHPPLEEPRRTIIEIAPPAEDGCVGATNSQHRSELALQIMETALRDGTNTNSHIYGCACDVQGFLEVTGKLGAPLLAS